MDLKVVNVNVSINYDVYIGNHAIDNIYDFVKGYKKVCIITDTGVPSSHLSLIKDKLKNIENLFVYSFEQGESSKCVAQWEKIHCYLAENNFTRKDLLIAVGGGVVGDLTGFVSSTYMRGIDFIQVPTTLLAQIDSSVGGKTAINIPQGKNLIGAFYQPKVVLCDTSFLSTLPKQQFLNGMGEGIKYACMNESIYNLLSAKELDLNEFIYECVKQKRDIVEEDEKESGVRKFLNLGHTFAHSIEKLSNFTVSHGLAVTKGLIFALRLSERTLNLNKEVTKKILSIIERYEIDTSCPYSVDEMVEVIKRDKKASALSVDFVLVEKIGKLCTQSFTFENLRSLLC